MLEAEGIGKTYGGVVALRGANLTVRPGSVHALLGENGAGKSTLVKIVAGAVRPDSGTIRLDGREVSFSSTAEAARAGLAVVSQELSLFPDLDVLANLFPMREPKRGPFVDRAEMARRARPVLHDLGLEVAPRTQVGELSLAQRQLLEIAKALVSEPRVLILDEPTSALEASSTEALMRVLELLRDRQIAVVFVSHILEEVMTLCDEITVLRDGAPVVEGRPKTEMTVSSIVEAMLGDRGNAATREPVESATSPAEGMSRLRLENVGDGARMHGVTFSACGGEVVGLAGLAGSGHRGVIDVVSGRRRIVEGKVSLPGERAVPRGLRNAIGAGVALVTGDRRRYGLMLDMPIWENIAHVRAVAIARDGVFLRRSRLRRRARGHIERLHIRTPSPDERAGLLSGGNQQKVVFAKWMDAEPTVLLLDDPTRGVDVGGKHEMHQLIRAAADDGTVVLLVSTDLTELCTLCDRVLVFFGGTVSAELQASRLTVHQLLETINTGERIAA